MYKNINANQFHDLLTYSNPIILDVRTQYEYDEGHIEGAILIPHNELSYRINEISNYKEQDILIYCHAGLRSVAAVHILHSQNFTSLYNLEGGTIAWENANKELVV